MHLLRVEIPNRNPAVETATCDQVWAAGVDVEALQRKGESSAASGRNTSLRFQKTSA